MGPNLEPVTQALHDVDGRAEFESDAAEAVLTLYIPVGEVAGKVSEPQFTSPRLEGGVGLG